MNRLKTIVSLLLAAVWLTASSHALLEHYEWIHHVPADHAHDANGSHEHGTDNHEAADGKCFLSSTHVSVPILKKAAIPFRFCASGLDWTAGLHVEPQTSGLALPGTAPPQLLQRWQFSFRTALPARAPSFAS